MIAALMALVITHIVPSAPGVRDWLIARLGRAPYFALHGAVSLALVGWIIWAYRAAPADLIWTPPPWHRWLAILAMPAALWLVAAGLMTRPEAEPRGIYRVSAAPASTGVLIWAAAHLANVAHLPGVALFAAFAFIAAAAMVKNWLIAPPARRMVGPVPFWALIKGRQRLDRGEFSPWPVIAAIAAWAGLLALHGPALGVDPAAGALW